MLPSGDVSVNAFDARARLSNNPGAHTHCDLRFAICDWPAPCRPSIANHNSQTTNGGPMSAPGRQLIFGLSITLASAVMLTSAQQAPAPTPGPFTAAQADQGRQLYLANCA